MAKVRTSKVDAPKSTNGKATPEKVVKASAAQEERRQFIEKHGKAIAQAFASFPKGKASSAAVWRKVFPKAETPQRLTDYALYFLGLRKTEDKGLIRWAQEDKAETKPQATPAPKHNGTKKA